MKILLISQSFMAPHIGPNEDNFGGTEAFCNNFCLSYHNEHEITVFAMKDATNKLDNVNLVTCDNYSRAYLENQTGEKARCNNGGLVNLINKANLGEFDLIIDNTCNKTVYSRLDSMVKDIALDGLHENYPRVYSIAHSRPSYAGRGVDEAVINMDKCEFVNFISVTESATAEWNKLSNKLVGHNVFVGSFGLRVLDKVKDNLLEFNYNNPAGLLVARIDPVKNFSQYQMIADNTK